MKTKQSVVPLEDAGWLTRLGYWFETQAYLWLIPGSSAPLTIWGALNKDEWHDHVGWLVVGVLALFLGLYWTPRKPSYRVLKADYAHLQKRFNDRGEAVERALETLLQKLAMDCGTDSHQDRVSAYYYHAGEFVLVGRYSKNPDHRQDGRQRYPVNQGVIGAAWRAPKGVILRHFAAGRERWIDNMIEDGFSSEEAAALTMQSRSIAAFRIEATEGSVGALVIESRNPKKIGADTLSKVQESLVYAAIADFIGGISPELPKAVDIGAGAPTSLFDEEWKPAASTK